MLGNIAMLLGIVVAWIVYHEVMGPWRRECGRDRPRRKRSKGGK